MQDALNDGWITVSYEGGEKLGGEEIERHEKKAIIILLPLSLKMFKF